MDKGKLPALRKRGRDGINETKKAVNNEHR